MINLTLILETLEQFGLAGLLLGVAIEAISFPFPAAIVILVYGYIMNPSGWHWFLLSIGISALYTAISYIPYYLSIRYDHLLKKRMNNAGSKRMIEFMRKYKKWAITAGRLAGMGYIVYVSVFYRIRPLSYGLYTFIGILPVSLLMLYLGSLGNIEMVYTWFQNAQYVIVALLVGAVAWYIIYRIKRRKEYRAKGH